MRQRQSGGHMRESHHPHCQGHRELCEDGKKEKSQQQRRMKKGNQCKSKNQTITLLLREHSKAFGSAEGECSMQSPIEWEWILVSQPDPFQSAAGYEQPWRVAPWQ